MTDNTLDKEIDEIHEGIYRWTIDCINMSIEVAAKKGEGLKQPILGTGKAPLLNPDQARAKLKSLILKDREKMLEFVIGEDEEELPADFGNVRKGTRNQLKAEQRQRAKEWRGQ